MRILNYILPVLSILSVIVITLGLVGLCHFIDAATKENDINKAAYDKHLGEKFVINRDTLMIIDYSRLDETYTLSNGTKISFKLVNK